MAVQEPHPPEAALAERLVALGNPVRISLLNQLRTPRTLGEIRISTTPEQRRGQSAGRVLARQSVRHHLDVLLAAGFVRARERARGHAVSEEYVVNHRRLFAMSEDVRALARIRSDDLEDATVPLARPAPAPGALTGPCLVVVHGVENGLAFPLERDGPTDGEASWLIGRARYADVHIDYDPFVSEENTRITRDADGAYWAHDLPGSRNGTSVNWTRVPDAESERLAHGDVLGVGRTLLVFRS